MVVNVNFFIDEPTLAFLIVFVPFLTVLGIKAFTEWITDFIKVRRGFFSVNWIMKNHQWRDRMIKPNGNNVKIEDKPQPFINNPNFTAFKGAKKIIFFSRIGERLKQLQIKADTDRELEKSKGIPPETEFNDMLDGAEMSGSIFGLKKSQFEKILLYIAVIAAAGALIAGVVNINMSSALDIKLNQTINSIPTTDSIKEAVKQGLIDSGLIRLMPIINRTVLG